MANSRHEYYAPKPAPFVPPELFIREVNIGGARTASLCSGDPTGRWRQVIEINLHTMPGNNALEIAKVIARACNGDKGVSIVSIYKNTEESSPTIHTMNGKNMHDS